MVKDKSSLLYWYPKIKNLDIPIPKTEIIRLTEKEKEIYYHMEGDCFNLSRLENKTREVIKEKFSLPVFIRTDEFSNKHFWKKSCFLDKLDNLEQHLFELISGSKLADFLGGLPMEAMIVREYIQMDTKFYAFYGEMPVNPERRYFIRDGEVECHHPYWIEDAVERGTPEENLPENWREIAKKINYEQDSEIKLLTGYSKKVAQSIEGYWSVDFCKSSDNTWILIDMAEGEKSWHPSDCKYSNMSKEDSPLPDFDNMIIEKNQ